MTETYYLNIPFINIFIVYLAYCTAGSNTALCIVLLFFTQKKPIQSPQLITNQQKIQLLYQLHQLEEQLKQSRELNEHLLTQKQQIVEHNMNLRDLILQKDAKLKTIQTQENERLSLCQQLEIQQQQEHLIQQIHQKIWSYKTIDKKHKKIKDYFNSKNNIYNSNKN